MSMAEIINFNEYLKKREVFLRAEIGVVENDECYNIASLDLGFVGGIRSMTDAEIFFKMLRPTIRDDIFIGLDFVDSEIIKKGKTFTEMAIWRDNDNGRLVITKIDVNENKNFKKMY